MTGVVLAAFIGVFICSGILIVLVPMLIMQSIYGTKELRQTWPRWPIDDTLRPVGEYETWGGP
jgi:hypothetical protein